jgi:cell division protein FtsB
LGTGRWLLLGLALVALTLQGQLWFSSSGFSKTQQLRSAVADQTAQNDLLNQRNLALEAEVVNLKQSLEAAEERARTDLGMIGPKETFYQVVPASDAPL